MRLLKPIIVAILMALPALAQNPQVPITGNIGAAGQFPILFPRTFQMTSDANATLAYPFTIASSLKVTSSVSLTATRNVIGLTGLGFFTFVENATTGGQAIQIIGTSGTGITIANGAQALVWNDGTNWTQVGGGGGVCCGALTVQVAGASGALAAGVGDRSFQSVASTPSGASQGSLQVIANNIVDQNLAFFTSDKTPYWCPDYRAYCSIGIFSEDYTYAIIQNPSKFSGVYGSSAIRQYCVRVHRAS